MEPGKRNCENCKRLIRLCGGLDFFPQDQEVQCLLVERLHRLAKDHEHARRMIDRWLDTHTAAPKPADLLALANELRSTGHALPDPCEQCRAFGGNWRVTDRGAERCTCSRGQALAAMAHSAAGQVRVALTHN